MNFREFLGIFTGSSDEFSKVDFKTEIDNAVRSGLITKAEAAELIQARKKQKDEAEAFDKMQTTVLEDGSRVSKSEAKKKKEELERKKKNQTMQQRQSFEQSQSFETSQKNINNTNDLRSNMMKQMENDDLDIDINPDIERNDKF